MSAEQIAAFEADANALSKIETVRSLHIGKPAATPHRPVIQTDYDYNLTVVLDDVDGHNLYQDHALHHDFVANQKAFFTQVRVFDSE